jgi:hypothetical protein
MILIRRPVTRDWHDTHPLGWIMAHARPGSGGALVMSPLPVGLNGQPFLGMDPSSPVTWVRPWNPQPGMISYLNFNGAARQGETPMGGVMRDAKAVPRAGVRPGRRPR